jgi:hypothetical protein
VCFVAQRIILLLVCTCGAMRSVVHRVHREEPCSQQSCSRPGAANAVSAGSSVAGSLCQRRPTMRAPDAGESARFMSLFPASAWFSSDGVPPSAPAQVTRAVSPQEFSF